MFFFHELLLFFDIIYNSSVINTQLIVEEGTRNDKDKAKTFAGKKNNNKAKNITITKIERTKSTTRVVVIEGEWIKKTRDVWCCLIPHKLHKNNSTVDD